MQISHAHNENLEPENRRVIESLPRMPIYLKRSTNRKNRKK